MRILCVVRTYKLLCFADGRLVSCFGKSRLEVSYVILQCCEISAQARGCRYNLENHLELISPPENFNLGARVKD